MNFGQLRYFRDLILRRFQHYYLADKPVDLSALGEFRGEAFPTSGPVCWLDQPDAFSRIEHKAKLGSITEEEAEICRKWVIDGYYIAPKLIDAETLDTVFSEYELAIAEGRVEVLPEAAGPDDPYLGRKLDPHLAVPAIHALMRDPRILRLTDLFFGRATIPFQTIMGHKGSQQSLHSDAIHMTTYPLGYLVANWIAFEDIHPDSGPLEYYPKSHRLPYILSADVGIPPFEFKKKGYGIYAERYEPAIRRYCETFGFERRLFCPSKGDVLFWHANLVHGGTIRHDLTHSRKALVCHYFAEGAFTYHDLSGNPTRLHANGFYAPLAF